MSDERYLYSVYPKMPIRKLSENVGSILTARSLYLTLDDVKACFKYGATVYRRFANEGRVERVFLSSAERLHQAKYMTEAEFANANVAIDDIPVEEAKVEENTEAAVADAKEEEPPVIEEVVEEIPQTSEEEEVIAEPEVVEEVVPVVEEETVTEEVAPVIEDAEPVIEAEETVEDTTVENEEAVVENTEEEPVAIVEDTTEPAQPQQHYKKQQIQFQYNNKKKNK